MRTERTAPPRTKDRQRGIALLAVMMALAICGTYAVQYAYEANIDYASAVNARDDMRASFYTRSGMNLSRLVVKVQRDVIDKYRSQGIGDLQLADYLPMIMGAFGGGKDEVESLAALAGNIDTANIKGLGVPEGEFDIKVESDDGKLNVNCAGGVARTQERVASMLANKVVGAQFDRLFEEPDGDGEYTDRLTFVRAIIDWIDKDDAGYGVSGQNEAYGYENFKEPYKPKNNYIDSLDELQLVRGMDDRRWELFSPGLTIYGGCKVNVAAATDLSVIAAVIIYSAKDPDDPVLRDPIKLYLLAQRVAQARAYGVMFDDGNAFMEFVKDPNAILDALLGGDDESSDTSGGDQTAGLLPAIEGVELDGQKFNEVGRVGGRQTYRVTATARIGRIEKSVIGLFDANVQNQNSRDPAMTKGAWLYWREN